jgi:hypothetical protein
MEVVPLSQFFAFTEGNKKEEFNAVNWLSNVDDAILERIIEASDLFFVLGEQDEAPFECLDYLTLCYMVGEKERSEDSHNFSEKLRQNCLIGMATFANCEKLRREGILTFTGEGKVTDFHINNTDIELTEAGKIVGSSIKTMLEISEAVEKD